MRQSLLLFILFGATALAQTSPAGPPKNRMEHGREFLGLGPAADPAAAARGAKLFSQSCAFCHGAKATGAEGPDLVRSSAVLHDEHGNIISVIVTGGRPDRGMPAFPSFTPDQLRDIAEFLHSRVEAAANRFGYRILNVVTGNVEAGKVFFDKSCTACHSSSGDLAHIAGRYQAADLQAQFLYPTGVPDTEPTVRVQHSDGATDSGKLVAIDDFTVTIGDANGTMRVIDRNAAKIDIHDPLSGHRELLAVYTNRDMHNVLAYLETLR